ncbi:MAG: energy-coupling factor transporter ATPase [Candidatus Jordarchaeaceae archaeon]
MVKNLSYRYPNSEEEAIHNIDLKVERGEFVLLVGRSGCGKTTLARCLNGLIPHIYEGELKGQVIVDGVSVVDNPVYELAKHVGMVFQNPDTQLCTLTVEEEVAFGPENLGVEREEIMRRVNWILSSLGMENIRHRATFSLSEGEKQKVAIASVLSMLPSILVLDEPTANLDPVAAKMLVSILDKIRDEYNVTIVLIEHRVDKFSETANRIVVMDSGKIVENGPREIITEKSEVLREIGVQLPEIVEICKALKISPMKGSLNELRSQALEKLAELKGNCSLPRMERKEGNLIKFENVSYRYSRGFTLKVDDLKLQRGEIVAVIGNNGSGKTTLAKLIVGLIKPKKGRIVKSGKISCGMVFQNFEVQLFNNSVFNEVAFQVRIGKGRKSPEEINREVNEVLELMNLKHLASRHPHSLSQGEKQRVAIAALIAKKPDILILDEPTAGQDGYHLNILAETFRKLKERGITILLITHDLGFAAKTAERVIIMNNGEATPVEDTGEAFNNIEKYTCFEPLETVKLARMAGLKNPIKPEDLQTIIETQYKTIQKPKK